MLGVPAAEMQEMLLDPAAVNHPDRISLIVPMEVPHSLLVANHIRIKLDGLVYIANKRRAQEARRLRKVVAPRLRLVNYFLNGPKAGEGGE